MSVPSQGHYGFHSFRLLTDFVCLYTYEFWLSLRKIVRNSVILLLPLFELCLLSSYAIESTINCKNEWYICELLTNYGVKHILPKGVNANEYLNHVSFPTKIQISKPIDVQYIRVYVWLKDDQHVI